ncbi:MAG: RNA polymerase sigma factor [Phycisphaeraceae bacterium]|nr:RNA polymerase sigma factor [Phycisphaeraceae bacterium]
MYARRVFALARSRVRDADLAEKITPSAVFADRRQVEGRSGGLCRAGKFEPWLFRIAVNRIRDEIRRSRRQAAPTDPEALAGVAAEPGRADPDAPAMEAAARGAIERLSNADRQVIELRHHAGMSFAEMAETLEEPLGTLLARHHRALRKLKDLMQEGTAGTASARAEDREHPTSTVKLHVFRGPAGRGRRDRTGAA